MGKGTIISGGTDGSYQVQINYGQSDYTAKIAALDASIAMYDEKISAWDGDAQGLAMLKLGKASAEVSKASLSSNTPADETQQMWCADLTEDLSGEVGTIEVPGESVDFNVQPGYEANAAYDTARDGQLVPTITQSAAAAFYNLAMLPGWQKWKPTFRYGVISNLNGDVCTVTLDSANSSQQNINVNQSTILNTVPIEYMSCNGSAFEDGDAALVMFTDQDFSQPKVIGFKIEPKSCGGYLYILLSGYCFVWDTKLNAYATDIPLNSDPLTFASFPIDASEISTWVSSKLYIGESILTVSSTSSFTVAQSGLDTEDSFPGDCWITDTTGNSVQQITGIDETGNSDGHSYSYTFEAYNIINKFGDGSFINTSNTSISYDIKAEGANIYNIMSLTDAPGIRGRSVSRVDTANTYEKYCQGFTGDPELCVSSCDGQDFVQSDSVHERVYQFNSPFSDIGIFDINVDDESAFYFADGGSCSANMYEEEIYTGTDAYTAKGIVNDTEILIFYAEHIKKKVTTYSVCGRTNFGDIMECIGIGYGFCTDEPVITYEDGQAFNVVAFYEKATDGIDPMSFDPFDTPENVALSDAFYELHTFYEGEVGAPTGKFTSNTNFAISFIS